MLRKCCLLILRLLVLSIESHTTDYKHVWDWCTICIQILGAADDTSRVAHPTVESVWQEFYRAYPGLEDFVSCRGEIPVVGRTVFKEHIVKTGFKFVKCRDNNRSYITFWMEAAVDRLSYLRDIIKSVKCHPSVKCCRSLIHKPYF